MTSENPDSIEIQANDEIPNNQGSFMDEMRKLLFETIDPINNRLANLESTRVDPNEDRHHNRRRVNQLEESDYGESSGNESSYSEESGVDEPMTSDHTCYILPRNASVRQQVVEIGDISVGINGINSPIEVLSRNGKHVVKPLRRTQIVDQLLDLCEKESEIEVKTSEFSAIKAPLHSALQPELGWEVKADKQIQVSSISSTLSDLIKAMNNKEELRPTSDALKFSSESHHIIGFALAPRLTDKSHELSGILSGLTSPIPKETRNKDYMARKDLLMWIKIYESANITSKLLDTLPRLEVTKSDQIASVLRESNKIKAFVDSAVKQPMVPGLLQALNSAKEARLACREAATKQIYQTSVQFTLRTGPLFIPTLYHQVKLKYMYIFVYIYENNPSLFL